MTPSRHADYWWTHLPCPWLRRGNDHLAVTVTHALAERLELLDRHLLHHEGVVVPAPDPTRRRVVQRGQLDRLVELVVDEITDEAHALRVDEVVPSSVARYEEVAVRQDLALGLQGSTGRHFDHTQFRHFLHYGREEKSSQVRATRTVW